MPSPSLMEWCTSSISSIRRSVHEIIHSTKAELEISLEYSNAIQALRGNTPGDKRRHLNDICSTIVQNVSGGDKILLEEFRVVPAALLPIVSTVVANKLQQSDTIAEALKSNDENVVKEALRADWFFSGANEKVTAEYFLENILPFISMNTRNKIINKLSKSLIGHEDKAENFYNAFVETYGLQTSLPILESCSEIFIFEKILEYNIILPLAMVNSMYKRYPDLVIRYLQLGNNNYENDMDRQKHTIHIYEYDRFLPKLIKNHAQEFVQFYKLIPEKSIQISNTESKFFLKNLKGELIQEPNIFLKLLPLKVIRRSFSKEDCEQIFKNLFPKNCKDFNVNNMLDHLENFQYGDRLQLLLNTYEEVYNKCMLQEKLHFTCPKLFKILPPLKKGSETNSLWRKYENLGSRNLYVKYLPPSEAIPILQKRNVIETDSQIRISNINDMIISCSFYSDEEELKNVLEYYWKKHKNEQPHVLGAFITTLKEEFGFDNLNEEHWLLLHKILYFSYAKKEIFKIGLSLIESTLEAMLRHYLMMHHKDDTCVYEIFLIMVETNVEHFSPDWNYFKNDPVLERNCLEKLCELVTLYYPKDHGIWKKLDDRLSICLNAVASIDEYNRRNPQDTMIQVENYPWITEIADEFFHKTEYETSYRRNLLMKLLKRNALEFYEAKMDEHRRIREIESGDALELLKRDPKRILHNWLDYLTEAREKLYAGSKAAKNFVAATKWHADISDKFIERCVKEIETKGSMLVIGVIVSGEDLEKILSHYLPRVIHANKSNVEENFEIISSILKAIRWTSTPISLDTMVQFCQVDYVSLTEGTIMSLAQRTPANDVIKFAEFLLDQKISLKKQGFRLIQRVATKIQLREFLTKLWDESNLSVRQPVALMMLDMLIKSPSPKNWELVEMCMKGLTTNDREVLEKFSESMKMIDKRFAKYYVEKFSIAIDNLSKSGLDPRTRNTCVCLLFESIDAVMMNSIPEDVGATLLKRYFLDVYSTEVSETVQNFAMASYLLPAGESFKDRLKTIMEILKKVSRRFDVPHPRKPRFYPANHNLRKFFARAVVDVSCCETKRASDVIDGFLNLFRDGDLRPWQEPTSFILLTLYKDYLVSKSPKDFGTKCSRRIPKLMQKFVGNDNIVVEIAEILKYLVKNCFYKEITCPDFELSIIDGLIDGDYNIGSCVGIKLLNHEMVAEYGDRYDSLVQIFKNNLHKTVQYHFYDFINRIPHDYDSNKNS